MNRSQNDISLRPFPYPYRAGFALCSDIDFCTRDVFVAAHRFLNSEKDGLGLPVADSFFGIGQIPGQMAYFLDDGKTPSKDAEFIRQAIECGLIDCLHTWGDFNFQKPDSLFLRILAQNLVDEFERHDLKIRAWINHGDSCNLQNMHARLNLNYRGDKPDQPYYTADLMKRIGIRYYWWSELMPWPLSGIQGISSPYVWPRVATVALKNMMKVVLNRRYSRRKARQIVELAAPFRLADMTRIIGFSRYHFHPEGIWTSPTRENIHLSLSPKILDNLVQKAGYLILYSHLGLPMNPKGDIFPDEEKKVLTYLSDQYHGGNIWVAPTVDILNFWMMSRYLKWRVEKEGNQFTIHLESLDDPVTEKRLPEKDEVAGLSFYSPRPDQTRICLEGNILETTVNLPDHTNMGSVSIPVKPVPCTDILEA